jgi:hypothetical protein
VEGGPSGTDRVEGLIASDRLAGKHLGVDIVFACARVCMHARWANAALFGIVTMEILAVRRFRGDSIRDGTAMRVGRDFGFRVNS